MDMLNLVGEQGLANKDLTALFTGGVEDKRKLLKECGGHILVEGSIDKEIAQKVCAELRVSEEMILVGVLCNIESPAHAHAFELLLVWSKKIVNDLLANLEGKVEEP